jgi:hypothetical protein
MNEPSSNRFTRTRTKGGVLAVIAGLALTVAAPIGAGQARHLTIDIHESFPSAFLSNACKTDVVVSFDATLNVTLVYNQTGLLVKEVDPSGGGRVTYRAPLTGNSFSFPFQTTIIDYGVGAMVGSTFTMKLVGLFGHVPGLVASDAGQLIVSGVVEGFDENGSPQLEITDFVREHGNRERGDDVTAAICTALTA